MLYIERDADGAIVAIRRADTPDPDSEPVSLMDDEVLAFLAATGERQSLSHLLMASDGSMVRVLEDLIDLLIAKNIILFTDLPPAARDKIMGRKRLRARLADDQLMVDDIL